MHKSHFTLGLLAAIILSATTAATSAASLDEIKKRGSIVIGVDFAHPPFGGIDAKSERFGSDLETATLLAKDLGVKLEMVNTSTPNRIPFLVTGKVDLVVANLGVTEERRKVIDFSSPYGVVPVVVSGPSKSSVKSAADLRGQQVAVSSGGTSDIELTRLTKDVPDVSIVRYADEATMKTAVLTQQQKFSASTLSDFTTMKEQNPSLDLENKFTMRVYPMAVGVKKNEPQLLEWTNQWVKENVKNGKLNEIFVRWFKQPLPDDILTLGQ